MEKQIHTYEITLVLEYNYTVNAETEEEARKEALIDYNYEMSVFEVISMEVEKQPEQPYEDEDGNWVWPVEDLPVSPAKKSPAKKSPAKKTRD